MMKKARIRRYFVDKKYGFLSPLEEDVDGIDDVFFHLSAFEPLDGPPPIQDEWVTYQRSTDFTKAIEVIRERPPAHETGRVYSYDPVRGYGFILSPTGQRYLHRSEVLGGRVPAVGDWVQYYVTDSNREVEGKSARACYVSILT